MLSTDNYGNHMSVMRTLLLLNTTQRKLQFEEHILDSSHPLRALQLSKVAQRLNDHLHNEQDIQTRSPVIHHTDFRNNSFTVVEEEEIDDEIMYETVDAHPAHSDIQTTVEITQTDVTDDDALEATTGHEQYPVSINIDTEAQPDHPMASEVIKVQELSDEEVLDEDLAEFDITNIDLEDMPTLSRQISAISIPALYHSDEESDEESHTDNVSDCESAVQRFLSSHNKLALHPATGMFDKTDVKHHSLPAASICA